ALERADRKIDLISLVMASHFGFADLTSASSYAVRRQRQTHDTTDVYLTYSTYTNFPNFVSYSMEDRPTHLFSEELRLVSSGDSKFKYIAGVYFTRYTDGDTLVEFMPGYPAYAGIDRPDQIDTLSITRHKVTDKAVFGEVGYQFTPAWQVTVGGRTLRDQF